jgi:hypothetical protein
MDNSNRTVVAFVCGTLHLTGGTLNQYLYACALKKYKNINSIFLLESSDSAHDQSALDVLKGEFPTHIYRRDSVVIDLKNLYDTQPIKVFYFVTYGNNDPLALLFKASDLPFAIHVSGVSESDWGPRSAYVSEWMSRHCSNGRAPFVPHIVSLPHTMDDLRGQLSIPVDHVVIGRIGGGYSWNIHFVNQAILDAVRLREDLYFLLFNVPYFYQYFNHPRIKIFGSFPFDLMLKRNIINTCDAMIHARSEGESFGFAPAEFSLCGKPVITYRHSTEKAHLDMLGKHAVSYESPDTLLSIFLTIGRNQMVDWNRYAGFNSKDVIEKFCEVFYDA